jgi:hypothetical protein
LLRNPDLLKMFSVSALAFSKQFSWDNTAAEFDKIIRQIVPHVEIELEKAIEVFKKSEQYTRALGPLLIKRKMDDTLKVLDEKKDL